MRKIDILYLIEYLAYGGTEKQLMSLINGLDRDLFTPHLCCLRLNIGTQNRKNDAQSLFEKIHCEKLQLNYSSFKNVGIFHQAFILARYIKSNNISIIQSYFQDPTELSLITGKICGLKHIIACFRDLAFWNDGSRNRLLKHSYKLCSHYIVNSKAVQDAYQELFRLPANKFKIIYNGIDTREYIPKEDDQLDKTGRINVCLISNLNRKVKRIDVFILAAAQVIHEIKNIKFLIAGEGEYRTELERMTRQLGLSSHISFLGRVDNVPELLRSIDIGIMSSDSEGFSNAIMEYMSSGIPVIATDVGGNKEIVRNGYNGFLVAAGDHASLANKIVQLAGDHSMRKAMGSNAHNTIKNKFEMQTCIKQYQDFYLGLLADPK